MLKNLLRIQDDRYIQGPGYSSPEDMNMHKLAWLMFMMLLMVW